MHVGSLYLARDSAHIVTPAGGKGMNLALQDVAELVPGLIAFYRSGSRGRLDVYSSTRLPKIWRTVEFSHWMLQMILRIEPTRPRVSSTRVSVRRGSAASGGRHLGRRLCLLSRWPRQAAPRPNSPGARRSY